MAILQDPKTSVGNASMSGMYFLDDIRCRGKKNAPQSKKIQKNIRSECCICDPQRGLGWGPLAGEAVCVAPIAGAPMRCEECGWLRWVMLSHAGENTGEICSALVKLPK